MSGGFFEYQDYRLEEMAQTLRLEIAKSRRKPDWTTDWSNYSNAFIMEMSKAYNQLVELRTRLHRLDWVLSGDDGEDTYFRELPNELGKVEFDDPGKDEAWLADEKERIDEWKKEYGQ